MYLLFFAVWLIFNGQITLEIVLFGLAVAAAPKKTGLSCGACL